MVPQKEGWSSSKYNSLRQYRTLDAGIAFVAKQAKPLIYHQENAEEEQCLA